MADLAHPISLAKQIALIARLRWRIFRSRLRRKNETLEMIGMIATAVLPGVGVLAIGTWVAVGAYLFIVGNHIQYLSFLFWGIFIVWHFLPVMMSSFTVQFDFRNLLRFPLSLPAFYILSLTYGLADPAALGALFWCVCMLGGIVFARPELFPAATLVIAVFALSNVVLDRMIGSWLERILARRRAREAFVALFLLAMVSLQFSGMIAQRWGGRLVPIGQILRPYLGMLPPGLAVMGLQGAAENHPAMLLGATAGVAGYGVLFGYFLWVRLHAQYRGEDLGESRAPSRIAARPGAKAAKAGAAAAFAAWLPGPIAAVAEKELHYLFRNSITLMNLFVPPLVSMYLAFQFGRVSHFTGHATPAPASSGLMFPGLIGYILLLITAPAYNSFAYEGRGIQTYLVSPVNFSDILAGKNLTLGLVLAFEAVLTGTLLSLLLGRPPIALVMATLGGAVFSSLMQFSVGNLTSLRYPRRLEFGQLRNQRASGITMFILFGMQILLLITISGLFWLTRWLAGLWMTFGVFVVLSVGAAGIYRVVLEKCNALAITQREVLSEKLSR